jgi:hypothetical protein
MMAHQKNDQDRVNPTTLEPMDEYAGVDIGPRPGAASARVVFSSVFLLSALGLGAFLLMYSSVHAGELPRATAGAALRQPEVPAVMAPAAIPPAEMPAAPPSTPTPAVGPMATANATAPPDAAVAPLADAVLVPLPPETGRAASAPTPRAVVVAPPRTATTVRVEPEPVKNPYDDTATATPPHSDIDAPLKAAAAVRAEPEPEPVPARAVDAKKVETNPYDPPAPTER